MHLVRHFIGFGWKNAVLFRQECSRETFIEQLGLRSQPSITVFASVCTTLFVSNVVLSTSSFLPLTHFEDKARYQEAGRTKWWEPLVGPSSLD